MPDARPVRRWRRAAVTSTVLVALFGVPWVALVALPDWPVAGSAVGTLVLAAALIATPVATARGRHGAGRSGGDRATVTSTTLLGVGWVLFVWSSLGLLAMAALALAGVGASARGVAAAVLVVVAVLLVWGHREAMRVPRIVRRDVVLDRLGAGLDGLRVALITDTHYGPLERSRWSADVVERLRTLDADVVCHVGDLADGTVAQRRPQAAPLAEVTATLARVYVTGNHEYYGEAQGWCDFMTAAGWSVLNNRHLVVRRGGDALVVAGVDDATAAHSGLPGHGEDLAAALAGAPADTPVLLLAHQPAQVPAAVAAGVDLQVSGHTHGGQIWPFGLLVRLQQPTVAGLSRHGAHTQLYTSRGTGFWGPPLRIFAPSEITLLTLRRPR